MLPISVAPVDQKPTNGVCSRNTNIVCDYLLFGVADAQTVDNCVDCICDEINGATCCPVEPFPKVKHPRECEVILNTETCTYQFTVTGRCRSACDVVGYEYSVVEGFDDADKIA
ncbi:hypothetical protein BSL78_20174 [Apostichopus japonicus]|uniref:Uncharacterized protein n=1 Tax=Stichopus japonicus TaxID=307972 RepID=A0A2G8K4W4_STIJA|nr:hypothetical protein BSL78_20174 [Apostichopus japonicus]